MEDAEKYQYDLIDCYWLDSCKYNIEKPIIQLLLFWKCIYHSSKSAIDSSAKNPAIQRKSQI